MTLVFWSSWILGIAAIIFTWLCLRNVPAATSTSNSAVCMNSKYGATSMSTITLRGSTQPQGEPMGVELMGAGQTVLEQPASGGGDEDGGGAWCDRLWCLCGGGCTRMPGDPGDNILGENAGEIRGPNTLISGEIDGCGAALGIMFA